jgi:hypothetical protein
MLPCSIDLEVPLHATSYAGMDSRENGGADIKKYKEEILSQDTGAGRDRTLLRTNDNTENNYLCGLLFKLV